MTADGFYAPILQLIISTERKASENNHRLEQEKQAQLLRERRMAIDPVVGDEP